MGKSYLYTFSISTGEEQDPTGTHRTDVSSFVSLFLFPSFLCSLSSVCGLKDRACCETKEKKKDGQKRKKDGKQEKKMEKRKKQEKKEL